MKCERCEQEDYIRECACKKGYTCVMCTMELMDEENLLE